MRVNIYIRKENEELWNQLEDKSDLINNWLTSLTEEAELVQPPQIAAVCKVHGIPLDANGKCMQKGCPYA